jgi:hypothetical protein
MTSVGKNPRARSDTGAFYPPGDSIRVRSIETNRRGAHKRPERFHVGLPDGRHRSAELFHRGNW